MTDLDPEDKPDEPQEEDLESATGGVGANETATVSLCASNCARC